VIPAVSTRSGSAAGYHCGPLTATTTSGELDRNLTKGIIAHASREALQQHAIAVGRRGRDGRRAHQANSRIFSR
jgi:hypothetical protein